ncbi:hypothetical protein AS593_08350 [Caulobacter vibrioides]|nr:hypothetical protein AS593_08350 [Caulobacter vibrioides]
MSRRLAAVCAALLAATPAQAQSWQALPPAQQSAGIETLLNDFVAEVRPAFTQDGPLRQLSGETRPRAEAIGVCGLDRFTIAVRAAPEGTEVPKVRGVRSSTQYLLVDDPAATLEEQDAACAGLADARSVLWSNIPATIDFFLATDLSAVMAAKALVTALRAPDAGLVVTCAQGRCPEAAVKERLFRPRSVSVVTRRDDCRRGVECYRVRLETSLAQDAGAARGPDQAWSAVFDLPAGSGARIRKVTLVREAILAPLD